MRIKFINQRNIDTVLYSVDSPVIPIVGSLVHFQDSTRGSDDSYPCVVMGYSYVFSGDGLLKEIHALIKDYED